MGFYTDRKGVRYARATVSGKTRKNVRLEHPEAEARQRAELIDTLARQLRDAEQSDFIEKVAEQAATLPRERLPELTKIVAGIVAGKEKPAATASARAPLGLTLSAVAKAWTSGELAKKFPDHVRVKQTSEKDASCLQFVVNTVGDLPVTVFRLEHAEQVMAALPSSFRPATRRQYAQAMHRLLGLCVYPLAIIPTNPLPKGFLPKPKKDKTFQVLFPDEEAKLLGSTAVPLVCRMLWGFLARMGFRTSEAIGNAGEPVEGEEVDVDAIPALTWDRFDLARGTILTTRSKNEKERQLALPPDVAEALRAWRSMCPGDVVFPIGMGNERGLADVLRKHAKLAGIDRTELHTRTPKSEPLRAHDLRALYVTVQIAKGAPEHWIRDFTGHKTTSMLDNYRRMARQFEALGQVELEPMHLAIPELSEGLKRRTERRTEMTEVGHKPEFDLYNQRVGPHGGMAYAGDLKGKAPSPVPSEREFRPTDSVLLTHAEAPGDGPPPPSAAGDPVETALAGALTEATKAGRWDLVGQLAKELEARRLARAGNVVPIDLAKKRGAR